MKLIVRVIISSMMYSSIMLSGNIDIMPYAKLDKNALRQNIKDDPSNHHYTFDLAQILQCSKKYDKAIKLFNKSKLLEGERGWYSEYMIGRCYDLKEDWENALKYYNSAFERCPSRAEPLYDIAQYYFDQKKYLEAYHFANIGRKIPCPPSNALFIERDIYHYKFYQQLTIAAYYIEKYKHKGQKFIDKLLFDHNIPTQVKLNCFNNLLCYAENIKNVEFIPIQVNTPLLCDWSMERYKPYNPSIIKTAEGYIVNCRSVNCMQWYPNYVVIDDSQIPKTKNVFVEYDQNLTKGFEAHIIENPSFAKYQSFNQGLEDLRLFHLNNEIYFIATTCQLNAQGIPKMCCGKFERNHVDNTVSIDSITLLQGPIQHRPEKNWMPIVLDDELYLIYSFCPYVIYKPNLETGECTQMVNKDPGFDFSRFLGSAPPIPFDEGYLLMVHEGIWRDRKYYVHRFVYLDKNLEIKKCSRPFTFKHKGIEMCCGMVVNHAADKLIMAIALEDREAYFGLIDLNDVRALLKPLVKN